MKRRLAKEFQPKRKGERDREREERDRERGREGECKILLFHYSELLRLVITYHTYCRLGLCFLLG